MLLPLDGAVMNRFAPSC